jgi:catechol 2,3-dioxygenase-like lactoylglutathione lyase family enzyme
MGLHRLLAMRIGVPDAGELGSFYGEMGLSHDGSGRFVGSEGGAAVHVEQYPFRRLLEVVVGAADARDLADAAERLTSRGLAPTTTSDAVSVVDPHSLVTFRVEVAEPFSQAAVPAPLDNAPGATPRRNARAGGVFAGARAPRRLGHLVLGTPDLAATRDLLVEGLGFKVSDDMAPIISFLRCSTDHHNVGIVESPVPLLQHYSWECDDVDHVGHSATKLLRADKDRQVWGFGRHYVGSNYYWYLRDPSGSFVELYSDMDVIDDDEAWEREGRTPVGFEHVANSWGPDIPMEFIAPTDLEHLQAAWAARG